MKLNLKQAREKNKLPQFIKEQEKQKSKADKRRFTKVLKAMSSRTAKPVQGTSRKGSSGS